MDKELPVSCMAGSGRLLRRSAKASFGKVYKAQRTERGKIFLFSN